MASSPGRARPAGATGPAATSAGSGSTGAGPTRAIAPSPTCRARACRPVITQNVDGLHQAPGPADVVELHGSLDRRVCLTCGDHTSRIGLHERMTEANPGFMTFPRRRTVVQWTKMRPDGDIVLDGALVEAFHGRAASSAATTPSSPTSSSSASRCPRPSVEQCFALVEGAGALLVLGSSLAVMSGYRFVRRAPPAACRSRSSRARRRAATPRRPCASTRPSVRP